MESTADQVRTMERRALPLVVDVTDSDQVQTMVDRAVEELGGVDILVNNAAYPIGADRAPIVEVAPDVFRRVVDIKVTGTYLCTQAFLKAAGRRRGGKIVNVASAEGKRGKANTLAYNAANFAVVGMTQSMALELGPLGINVNCVCRDPPDSAHGRNSARRGRAQGRRRADRRLGTDEEIGGFIAYLCTRPPPGSRPVHQHQRRPRDGALRLRLASTQVLRLPNNRSAVPTSGRRGLGRPESVEGVSQTYARDGRERSLESGQQGTVESTRFSLGGCSCPTGRIPAAEPAGGDGCQWHGQLGAFAGVPGGPAGADRGGNAFDAATSVAATLGVVEPYMSGPGGIGLALAYVARERRTRVLNFSGRARWPRSRRGSPLNPSRRASSRRWCPATSRAG